MTAPELAPTLCTLTERRAAGVRIIDASIGGRVIASAYGAGGWVVDLRDPIETGSEDVAREVLCVLAEVCAAVAA